MQDLRIKLGVAVLAIFLLGGTIIIFRGEPKEQGNKPVELKTYPMSEVALHKDAKSCWIVVSSGVYDVTSWIKEHPGGGPAILSLCGTDATEGFTAQHGGQSRPEEKLASFLIGNLAPLGRGEKK